MAAVIERDAMLEFVKYYIEEPAEGACIEDAAFRCRGWIAVAAEVTFSEAMLSADGERFPLSLMDRDDVSSAFPDSTTTGFTGIFDSEILNSSYPPQIVVTVEGSTVVIPLHLTVDRAALTDSNRPFKDTSRTARESLAFRYLSGDGIEIGAAYLPQQVSKRARVRYVDRLTVDAARREFPEIGDAPLIEPDIIDDAETLSTIPDSSVDFVIANNVVEHLKRPLRAISNWLRVLKADGILYLVAPDVDNPLDHGREVTSFEHLLRCEMDGTCDLSEHYREYAESVFREDPSVWQEMQEYYRSHDYAIHFHTFDSENFAELLTWIQQQGATIRVSTKLIEPPVEHVAIIQKGSVVRDPLSR